MNEIDASPLKGLNEIDASLLKLLIRNQKCDARTTPTEPQSLCVDHASQATQKGDKTDPANDQGLYFTIVLLKMIEHILSIRHNVILDVSQLCLQK